MIKKEENFKLPEDANSLILPKNPIFSSTIRFTIMNILKTHKKAKFTEFQKLLNLSSGNLNYHIQKLEEADYIVKKQGNFLRRPLTYIEITQKGRVEIKKYSGTILKILHNDI